MRLTNSLTIFQIIQHIISNNLSLIFFLHLLLPILHSPFLFSSRAKPPLRGSKYFVHTHTNLAGSSGGHRCSSSVWVSRSVSQQLTHPDTLAVNSLGSRLRNLVPSLLLTSRAAIYDKQTSFQFPPVCGACTPSTTMSFFISKQLEQHFPPSW